MARNEFQVRASNSHQIRIYRAPKTGDICLHLWSRATGRQLWHSTPQVLYLEFDAIDSLIDALEQLKETSIEVDSC